MTQLTNVRYLDTPRRRDLLLRYYIEKIDAARLALRTTTDPIKVMEFNHEIDRHTAAVNRLDRECQEADRKAAIQPMRTE